MLKMFANKVAIITGTSGGIGSATATMMASLGASIVLTGRSQARLEPVKAKCLESGATEDKLLMVLGDITVADDLTNLVNKTIHKFGKIDILVNNAGFMLVGGYEKTTIDDVDTMYNINLRPIFILTQLCIPHLIESKGCIVNVSSLAGIAPSPTMLAYSMSKAALNHLSRSLALELAIKGVRVNAVNPTAVLTDLLTNPKGPIGDPSKADQFVRAASCMHPAGRIAECDDVARVISFLASEQSSFLTGLLIPVDGGRHATMWGCMPQPQPK